jgi:hypothetical protein
LRSGYDIHIVSNDLPAGLAQNLLALAYERRLTLGGDRRVRIEYLYTQKFGSRRSADTVYHETLTVLERYPSFVGYIEEEAIVEDLSLEGAGEAVNDFATMLKAFDDRGIHKKCDIHITTPGQRSAAIKNLRRAGFYRQRLEKHGLGPVTVLTVQSEDLVAGKRLWRQVLEYLSHSPSFRGSAKFEVTIQLKNFGFRIPPTAKVVT